MFAHAPSHIRDTDRIVAPLARTWQGVQNGVARLLWFKNAGNLSAVVGIAGLTTMAVAGILGPLAPVAYGAGLWTAQVGGIGVVENHITKKVANWDGKGKE